MGIRSFYSYVRHNMYHNPVIVWSFVFAIAGPLMLVTVYPARRELGYKQPVNAPRSFPIPNRARVPTPGYED